jgi:hypothetical protein
MAQANRRRISAESKIMITQNPSVACRATIPRHQLMAARLILTIIFVAYYGCLYKKTH